jgi:hypothetical protein
VIILIITAGKGNAKIPQNLMDPRGKLNMTKIDYEYHHMGIPTNKRQLGEKYSSTFKIYTTAGDNEFRIQWHRFEEGSPLHPLIQSVPHVAFKVSSIDEAIKGKKILLEPYYPFESFRVAMVEIAGAPVEFIETKLSENEIWGGSHKGSVIYPENEDE